MKHLTLYIDIVLCLIVLPLMALLFPVERWIHNFPWFVMMTGAWLYAVYFINRFVAVPSLMGSRRSRLLGEVLILVSVLGTYLLSTTHLYEPKPNIFDEGIVRVFPNVAPYQAAIWTLFAIVETYSFAVGLLVEANRQRATRRKLEAEHHRAQLELYKAQIKPHFMFNTLNTLYGLFLTRSDKALDSLERFIGMIRYISQTTDKDLVALNDEVDYIRRFVELQSLRLNDLTKVKLDVDVEHPDLMVPPMLLVTFVENCFKHGTSTEEQSRIVISLRERGCQLTFSTSNKIFPINRIGEHMGINNCRSRLQLLFPHRHRLDIANTGGEFNVNLSIDLRI